MKAQDEMASQVISTKHTRNNLYKSFSTPPKDWRGKNTPKVYLWTTITLMPNPEKGTTKTELQANYCCSVAQSCPTLCHPTDCSTPGFPVLHHLPHFAQTQVQWIMMPSNSLVLCHRLLLLPSVFPSIRVVFDEQRYENPGPKGLKMGDWNLPWDLNKSIPTYQKVCEKAPGHGAVWQD